MKPCQLQIDISHRLFSELSDAFILGLVNISQTTYELLKDDPEFDFQSRGKIAAKGKVKLRFIL